MIRTPMETVDTESRVYTTRNVASLVASAFRDCRPEWMNLITDYLVSHGGMARHGLFARQEAAAYSTILSERPLCFVPGTLMSSLIVEVLKRSDRATLFPTFEATKPFPYDSDVDEKLHSEIADLASRFDVGTTCVAKAMTFVQSNVVAWIEIIPIPGRPAWFQEITTHLALYPHISHISHSCAPNIEFSKADRFAPNPLHIMSVYAIKPISVGDELFITLLREPAHISMSTADRRNYLRAHYKFTCMCTRCVYAEPEVNSAGESAPLIDNLVK